MLRFCSPTCWTWHQRQQTHVSINAASETSNKYRALTLIMLVRRRAHGGKNLAAERAVGRDGSAVGSRRKTTVTPGSDTQKVSEQTHETSLVNMTWRRGRQGSNPFSYKIFSHCVRGFVPYIATLESCRGTASVQTFLKSRCYGVRVLFLDSRKT